MCNVKGRFALIGAYYDGNGLVAYQIPRSKLQTWPNLFLVSSPQGVGYLFWALPLRE